MVIAKTTLILFVTILAIKATAQEKPFQLQRYGVKAGVQLSTIPTGNNESFSSLKIKPMPGYQFGGFVTIGLTNDFSLQTELFFSGQGFKESMTLNMGGGETEKHTEIYALRYIKLPVLLRYGVAKNIFIEAGPQFGVFVSSNIEKDEWSHFKKFDLAGAIGAEYILSEKLSAQLRYAHSFAEVENVDNYLWVPERPRVFSLGIAYAF